MFKFRSDFAIAYEDCTPKYMPRPLFTHNKELTVKLGQSFICKSCSKKYSTKQEINGYCKECYKEN